MTHLARRTLLAAALAAVAAVALAPTAAAQAPAAAATDTAALRAEIVRSTAAMMAAFNRGDRTGAAAFYADDAVIRSPGAVDATGRAAVDRYFEQLAGARSWTLEVLQVGGTRDAAWQTGRSTLVMEGMPQPMVVQYVALWRRQADGTLRIELDYYHLPERPIPVRKP